MNTGGIICTEEYGEYKIHSEITLTTIHWQHSENIIKLFRFCRSAPIVTRFSIGKPGFTHTKCWPSWTSCLQQAIMTTMMMQADDGEGSLFFAEDEDENGYYDDNRSFRSSITPSTGLPGLPAEDIER